MRYRLILIGVVLAIGIAAVVLQVSNPKLPIPKPLPSPFSFVRFLDGDQGVVVLVTNDTHIVNGTSQYPSESVIKYDVSKFEDGHLIAMLLDQSKGASITRYVVVNTIQESVYAEFESLDELQDFWEWSVQQKLELAKPANSIPVFR